MERNAPVLGHSAPQKSITLDRESGALSIRGDLERAFADMARERALPCLRHIWAAPFVGAARRFSGLRLTATDADWTEGDGPEVRGPVGSLLVAANGRAAGLDGLEGEGLDEARRRFTSGPSAVGR